MSKLFSKESENFSFPFHSEESPGLGIKEAFTGLTPDSSVKVEWFDDPTDKNIHIADHSIRDGRLHDKEFHLLTLSIQISFKHGDDKCKVVLGSYNNMPWFNDIFKKYHSETKGFLSKKKANKLNSKSDCRLSRRCGFFIVRPL